MIANLLIAMGAWWFWGAITALLPIFFLLVTLPYGLWTGRTSNVVVARSGRQHRPVV